MHHFQLLSATRSRILWEEVQVSVKTQFNPFLIGWFIANDVSITKATLKISYSYNMTDFQTQVSFEGEGNNWATTIKIVSYYCLEYILQNTEYILEYILQKNSECETYHEYQ